MSIQKPSKALVHLEKFASTDALTVRHTRRLHRAAWTLVVCLTSWSVCQLIILAGAPPLNQYYAPPGRPWFDRHFLDSNPLFDSPIVVGWVHMLQAALCLLAIASIVKAVRAHSQLKWLQHADKE